jgi:ATP-dependent helicase HrpA
VPIRQAVAQAVAGELEQTGLRTWPQDLDELPRTVERTSGGHVVRGYPALVDAGGTVDVRVFPTAAEQAAAMVPGTRRLLRLAVPSPVKSIERQLDPRTRLVLGANPDGSLQALLDDCADAATDRLAPAPAWSRAEFTALRDRVAQQLVPTTQAIVGQTEKVLAAAHEVELALPTKPAPAQADAIADIRHQIGRLLPKGFVTVTGAGRLSDLTRYLTAIGRRLDRLPHSVGADREKMQRVHDLQDALDDLVGALSPARAAADDIRDIERQIEELRVSLWAQQLGTPRPVSEQRIYRAIDAVDP